MFGNIREMLREVQQTKPPAWKWYQKAYFCKNSSFMMMAVATEGKVQQFYCKGKEGKGWQEAISEGTS